LRAIDAYWWAVNYLSVGQIYLLDNPLLREPLQFAHVKPRCPAAPCSFAGWGSPLGAALFSSALFREMQTCDEIKKQEGCDLTRFYLDWDLPDHFPYLVLELKLNAREKTDLVAFMRALGPLATACCAVA
jgi:hypothetical protein